MNGVPSPPESLTARPVDATAPATPVLWPIAASFAVFGVLVGSWAVSAADVEHELGVSHGTFGLLLSAGLAGGGLVNMFGGALAERHGTSRMLAASLAVWSAGVLATSLVQPPGAMAVLIVLTFSIGGLVDLVMNVAATAALAEKPGTLVRFHAFFNGGGAVGALAAGLLIANGVSWRWSWTGTSVLGFALAVVAFRTTLPAGERGEEVPMGGAIRLLRAEHLLLIAIAFALGAMVEGGIDLWGVLFLRTHFPEGLALAVTSAVTAYSIAALARVFIGPIAGRRSAAHGIALGAGAAAGGVLLLTVAPGDVLPGVGLVISAAGVSMCWPLLMALAGAGRERPGAVVGGLSAFGYTGLFLGPTIVGWVAAAGGLRAGLLLLAVAAVFVAIAPSLSGRMSRSAAG
jgi:MFS family permease